MEQTRNILRFEGITKSFPGVVALRNVSLNIEAGEVHILVGENGAGKSSLVKTICGINKPDAGAMYYRDVPFEPRSPQDAIEAGIRVVYQEFNLLPYLSVAENIYFERLPRKYGIVDYKKIYADSRELLEKVGLDIDPRVPVELLGIAQMQLIEIAKALAFKSRVLILDEPTATLTSREIERLFALIRNLRNEGVTVIYISHRLKEISEIGDRITVLRNGSVIETLRVSEIDIPGIVKRMVGRDMNSEYPFDADSPVGDTLLRVRDLRYQGNPHGISFDVRKGEILGIAGLVGSGRTETVRALFGADPKDSGTITLDGRELRIKSPGDAVREGICLLTEDRKSQGLILDMPCSANITITGPGKISRFGLLDRKKELTASDSYIKELSIKTPSPSQLVRNLSGGNQQKIIISKWLFNDARVLIFDEPTRGIDVGAKYEIYLLLWTLAKAGKSIIVISSDLPEVMGICHRLLVFSNGKAAGELERKDFDQERILSYAYHAFTETKEPSSPEEK